METVICPFCYFFPFCSVTERDYHIRKTYFLALVYGMFLLICVLLFVLSLS